MELAKRWVFWAGVGAVLGTALDAVHVLTGTLSYPAPTLWGLQAWWVPLLFAGTGVLLGEGHRHIAVRLAGGDVPPRPQTAELALAVGALVLTYGASGFLRAWPWVTTALFVAGFGAVWVRTPRAAQRAMGMHAVAVAVGGPLVEATLSGAGLFTYHQHDLLGVPVWLGALYLHGGAASAALDRWLAPAPAPQAARNPVAQTASLPSGSQQT